MVEPSGFDRFNEQVEDAKLTYEVDWGHDGRIKDHEYLKLHVEMEDGVYATVADIEITYIDNPQIRFLKDEEGGGTLYIDSTTPFEQEKSVSW